MKHPRFLFLSLVTLTSLVLGGCLTLASDVTPPPQQVSESGGGIAQAVPEPTATQLADSSVQSSPVPTNPAQDGSVVVQVEDETGGSLLESGLQISLEGYDQFDQVFQASTSVPLNGSVTFDEVPFEPGRVFFASVPYGGAIYRSEIVQVDQETSLNLQVQLYETTTDASNLLIDRLHVLIDFPQSGLIQVTEIFILSNLGSKTIVSGASGEPSAEFPLPENAGSIQFEDGSLGQRFLLTENGFGDTVSIPPGDGVYQVLVYFNLPFQGRRLNFQQTINYPLSAAVVMVPAGSATLTGTYLEDLGVQTLPEASVQVYSVLPIAPGESLDFQLSGITQNEPGASSGTQFLAVAAGAAGILLLGAGIWLYFRNRKRFQEMSDAEQVGLSQEEILDSILALEDLFQEGKISKESYQRKRAQLKEQLKRAAGGEE